MKSYKSRVVPHSSPFVNPFNLNNQSSRMENMESLTIVPPSKIRPKSQNQWPSQFEALLDVCLSPSPPHLESNLPFTPDPPHQLRRLDLAPHGRQPAIPPLPHPADPLRPNRRDSDPLPPLPLQMPHRAWRPPQPSHGRRDPQEGDRAGPRQRRQVLRQRRQRREDRRPPTRLQKQPPLRHLRSRLQRDRRLLLPHERAAE